MRTILAVLILSTACLAQGGMGPGPGTVHTSGGGHNYTPTFHAGGVSAPGISGSSQSLSVTVSAGDSIFVGVTKFNPAENITSVLMDDGGSTACTQLGTPVTVSSRALALFLCTNIPSGVTHVIVSYSASNFNEAMALPWTPGTAGSSALDVVDTVGNANTGTSATTGAMTIGNANDLIFGYFSNDSGGARFAGTGSWTLGYEDHSYAAQGIVYQVVSTTAGNPYTPAASTVSAAWYGRGASITLP